MSDAWRCDSCDTNNESGAIECRVCGLVPGSAAGTAQQVTEAFVPEMRSTPTPEFRESKHAEFRPHPPERVPVMPRLARTGPKAGNGTAIFVGFVIVAMIAILIALGVGASNDYSASSSSDSNSSDTGDVPTPLPGSDGGTDTYDQTTEQQPGGPPCPDAAAEYLPDGGSNSVLVAAYTSAKYTITLCQADDGQLYYDGQVTGEPPSDTTHISIPAQQTSGGGYTASNNGYTYDIEGSFEQLIFGGTVVERFAITSTGP